jgi:hypothetical protein
VDDKNIQRLQVDRYNDLLRSLLTIGPQVVGLGTRLVPNLALEVDRPEWGFLKAENAFVRRGFSAADPGNFSNVMLQNPAGSGVLMVCHAINCAAAASVTHFLRAERPGVLAAGATGQPLDLRNAIAQATVGNVQTAVSAALLGTELYDFRITESNGNPLLRPIIVAPGTRLIVSGIAINVAVSCTYFWTERLMEAAEKADVG